MEKINFNSGYKNPSVHISDKETYKSLSEKQQLDEERRLRKDYFESRILPKYEYWDNKLKPIINYLDQLKNKEIEPTERFVIICLGGGVSSVQCAAQLRALELLGIVPEIFKGKLDIYGISGGSGPAAFFANKDSNKALSLFLNVCTTKEFLNKLRVHKIIDTTPVSKQMRENEGERELIVNTDDGNRIFVVAQNVDTGENEIINLVEAEPDPVSALEASSAIPPFSKPITVNGKRYIDGGFEVPPLKKILDNSLAQKVIILPNTPMEDFDKIGSPSIAGKIIDYITPKISPGSMKTLESHFNSMERFKEFLKIVEKETGSEIAVLWPPDNGMSVMSNDKNEMGVAVLKCIRDVMTKFGLPVSDQPDRKDILPSF